MRIGEKTGWPSSAIMFEFKKSWCVKAVLEKLHLAISKISLRSYSNCERSCLVSHICALG